MLIRDVKIVFFCLATSALAFLVASWWILGLAPPDLDARPALIWRPTTELGEQKTSLDGVQINMTEALERPIFRIERRAFDPSKILPVQNPPVPVAETPVVPVPAPVLVDTSQFILKGLAIHSGLAKALIADAAHPDGQWLAVGEEIAGLKIVSLDHNEVELKGDQQNLTLSLYVDNISKLVGSP
jgi:hypothetical protein